jgi:WD40 repeat protein
MGRLAPGGGTLVSGSYVELCVWDATSLVLARTHHGALTCLATSPREDVVVTAGKDGTARVWRLLQG